MRDWICERLNHGIDTVIGFFIGGLLAAVFFVAVVQPYVVERTIERTVERVRTEFIETGFDPALTRRINLYLDQEGVPR